MPANIRTASFEDLAAVVETVVAAFRSDPAFRFFFPDDEEYDRQSRLFAGYLFDKRVRHNSVWVTEGIDAVSLWSPPQSATDPHVSADGRARETMLRGVGPEAAQRVEAYEEVVGSVLPVGTPYWYLGILALHPTRAGSGYGRAVMEAGLEHVRSVNGTAFLETSNPDNVGYYERLGWSVAAQVEGVLPIDVWLFTVR